MLGYIIEQVSGLSYETFLQQNILTPLNLADTGYGYGVILGTESGRPAIWHAGKMQGFISLQMRFPDDDVIVIVLSNQESAGVMAIADGIAAKIFNAEQ